ncbi:peptidylprolyl isomerase [bacterium]|nr:peptidylprolyl isomerase [bacterium]
MAGDGEAWEKELKEREADEKRDNPRVLLETEQGSIALELFEDTAPNTVANFVSLVEKGFYDGIIFHRVIPSFMAQGGDPDATGGGGPGYTIKDEAGERNVRLHWRGTLSMAKTAQPDTGGSQFFICYKPCEHLNHKHAVFGRVIEGQEAADRLEMGDAIKKATVIRKRNHPYVPETVGGKPWSSPPKAPDKKDEKSGEKKDEPPK